MRWRAAGIDAGRVRFLPQGRDDAENQARYRVIDFVLDPMPYGGVNGTLEALDMGVPVVTLIGARHAERTSYSILANLGVTDTVAQTGVDYVDIAVRLATDVAFAARVRERIREALRQSALTDMRVHARNLEQAYIDALEQRALDALADAGQEHRRRCRGARTRARATRRRRSRRRPAGMRSAGRVGWSNSPS